MDGRRRAPKSEGRRTTLRVPRDLDTAVGALASERATTTNEALLMLARLGAAERERREERLTRSRELVARFEAEHGAIPEDLLRDVDELWPA